MATVAVRDYLNQQGYSNGSIGYDPNRKMVTLNGKDFYTGTPESDGHLYGDDAQLTSALSQYKQANPTGPAISQADPQKVAELQKNAEQFRLNNWYNNGTTATPTTGAQNIAAVINQPGNAMAINPTPYIQEQLNQAKLDDLRSTQTSNPDLPGQNPAIGDQISSYSPASDNITDIATKTVNDKIAQQIAAYNQALEASKQANLDAANENNVQLQRALQGLGTQHTMDNSEARELQNRRGGFYSGGLDYQLGNQDRAYATQQGNLNEDTQNRNNALYANNALLAKQAAANIQMLQSQAPDMIRQAIQDELDRQRGLSIQEAALTGTYNGNPTLAAQNQQFNQGVAVAGLTGTYNGQSTLAGQNQQLNATQITAELTGKLPDGKPTNAAQQQMLENEWKLAEQTQIIPDDLADYYGIPHNTPTAEGKQQILINQQNEDARKAAANQQAAEDKKATNQQAYTSQLYGYLGQFNNANDAAGYLQANAADIVNNLGQDAYNSLLKSLPTMFPTTTDTSAKDTQDLRSQAIKLAQSDTKWSTASDADKIKMVEHYLTLLTGNGINAAGGVGTAPYGPYSNNQ